jgi:hypothetical protein
LDEVSDAVVHAENPMLRQEVNSSELRWVGYEESALLLEVEFHSGEVYRYFQVPAQLVLELWKPSLSEDISMLTFGQSSNSRKCDNIIPRFFDLETRR